MSESHAAGWASDAPTPAQLKELFAQIASRRVTGSRLQEFLRGEATAPAKPLVYDKTKDGWTRLEHVQRSITSITDLKLVPILKKGENSINGEEMVRRARAELNANFGQEDAEWLLEHQNEIPKEWRNYYLAFPGTVWQVSGGNRRVPYLGWFDAGWCLLFYWRDYDWRSGNRLLSVGKPACR